MEFVGEFFSLSFFFNEVNCLVEMLIPSLKPRTIVNDNFLILDAECNSLVDVMLLSLIVYDANLSITSTLLFKSGWTDALSGRPLQKAESKWLIFLRLIAQ
jgi:hypothetical protein